MKPFSEYAVDVAFARRQLSSRRLQNKNPPNHLAGSEW
jgi:hypothetical protein